MSELRDRLERLAARGTRRGADDVLRAAMREAPPIGVVPDAGHGDLPIIDDDVPFVTSEPDARRRGRFGTLVAAVGAAALIGVGALAVTAMFGSGGAGSPEGAVRQLADAVSHKDPLAAVDVLVPTEVRSMRESVKEITKRAADLKIVDDASAPLAGVDLSVDHLQLSTESLADGYAKVTVTSGDLSASTHQAAMSKLLQNAFHNAGTDNTNARVDLSHLASGSDLPTFVVVVRRDGSWYVSPAYTALEYAREIAGGPAAAFGSARAADLGADSPEQAVSDALHAWQAGNWDRLMALAPPDELPVYDYRAWIDHEAADTHPDFTIDKLSTSATVNGDTATVKLEASGTTGRGSEQGHWQVGGTCPAAARGWSSYSYAQSTAIPVPTVEPVTPATSSVGSSSSGIVEPGSSVVQSGENGGGSYQASPFQLCLAGDLGQELPFGLVAVGAQGNTPASGAISIEVVREGGRWFVSPVTTVLDSVDSFVNHVDEHSLYPLIGLGYLLPPDATIALDQPFTLPADSKYAHVYAFDGTAGQSVVGAGEGTSYFAGGDLYTADGHNVGFVDFQPKNAGYGGSTATLPTTGSYRLVVTGSPPKGVTLTLFDAAHAPKSLLNPDGSVSGILGEVCSRTVVGTTCSKSATATTVPGSNVGPSLTPAPVPTSQSGCRQTAGGIACSGSATLPGVATTSVP